MKRFLTLVLLFCLISNGLFAQKNRKNETQSFITVETGLSFSAEPVQNFSMPFNIEFQKIKNKWGFGAALGLDYDRYFYGNCNKRFETGSYDKLSAYLGNSSSGNMYHYCITSIRLNFKPSVFGSYYFFQKGKTNLFLKMGSSLNVLDLSHTTGEYFEYDPQSNSLGTGFYKITNGGPIHIVTNRRFWGINNIDLLSGLGMNYTFNKRTSLRFTLQSEVNIPFLSRFLYEDKGFLITGLCGLSFKI